MMFLFDRVETSTKTRYQGKLDSLLSTLKKKEKELVSLSEESDQLVEMKQRLKVAAEEKRSLEQELEAAKEKLKEVEKNGGELPLCHG